MTKPLSTLATILSVSLLGGCAVNSQTGELMLDPNVTQSVNTFFNDPDPCASNNAHTGIVIGALAGALLGEHNNGKKGALLGALAGGVAGGIIGNIMDDRRCRLYKIAQQNHLKLMSAKINAKDIGDTHSQQQDASVGLDVQLENSADEFKPGSAILTPRAKKYLTAIAQEYTPETLVSALGNNATDGQKAAARNRKVLIIGHTDARDNRSGAALAALSQARAKAVAEVFAAAGVPRNNIIYQGAGDMLPLASNASAQGRQVNNRVQIVDLPDTNAVKRYAQRRTTNPANFAILNSTVVTKTATTVTPEVTTKVINRPAPSSTHHLNKPTSSTGLHFDGQPYRTGYTLDLGFTPDNSSFHFIKQAQASERVVVSSCLHDKPHASTAMRNLASGKALAISDAIPGLYGQPWFGSHGQTAIGLLHVYAPQDAAAPVPPVTVEYFVKHNGKVASKAHYKQKNAPVNVYRGDKATLYRVFLDGPAQCMDLYVPTRANSAKGNLIYPQGATEFQSVGQYRSVG